MLPAPGGAVFRGIPFAAPPVGELRWREPQPVKAWNGIRDAGGFGSPCAQVSTDWNAQAAAAGSEDCLFLNVWTPKWPVQSSQPGRATALPVMFWIHGGANTSGSAWGAAGIEPPFDGEKLARHGVVVVTTQYRLDVFGFISHPELTAESPHHASGNYGLMDLIAALRWVHHNIGRFGGDPAKVTIFGYSAGALDVGLLMTSPLAKGLFHRAIEESGSVLIGGKTTPPLTQMEQTGLKLAEKLHAPSAGAIHFLRGLSTAELLKGSPASGGGGQNPPAPDPEPAVDGYVLPRVPPEVFAAGQEAPVPLIVGNNAREWTFPGSPDELKTEIGQFYERLTPQALSLYGLAGNSEEQAYPPHGDVGTRFRTDTLFRCAAVVTARQHSRRQPTFQYELTIGTAGEGAPHSGELQYVFGVRGVKESADPDPRLSGQIQEYWTNFAKTGDPNGGTLPVWPRCDSIKKNYVEFTNKGPMQKSALRRAFCEVFEEKLKAGAAQ